jgi:hypothetical protein
VKFFALAATCGSKKKRRAIICNRIHKKRTQKRREIFSLGSVSVCVCEEKRKKKKLKSEGGKKRVQGEGNFFSQV